MSICVKKDLMRKPLSWPKNISKRAEREDRHRQPFGVIYILALVVVLIKMQSFNIITASEQNAINKNAVFIDSVECNISLEYNKIESGEDIFVAERRTGGGIIRHSFNGIHKICDITVCDIVTT